MLADTGNGLTVLVMRKTLSALILTTALLTACSANEVAEDKPTDPANTTITDGEPSKMTAEDAEIFAGTCQVLASFQDGVNQGLADPAEVRAEIDKAVESSKNAPDEALRDAVAALGEIDSYEDAGFFDAYTKARTACAAWGASLSGSKPTQPANTTPTANPEQVAYGKTCGIMFNVITGYQNGEMTDDQAVEQVKSIETNIDDLSDEAAREALQDLVKWAETGEGTILDLFGTAATACQAISPGASAQNGG